MSTTYCEDEQGNVYEINEDGELVPLNAHAETKGGEMIDTARLYALTDEQAAAARITLAYMRRTQIDAEHEAKFAAAYNALMKPVAKAAMKGGEMMGDVPEGYYWDRDDNLFLRKEDGTVELVSFHADLGDTVIALSAEVAALKAQLGGVPYADIDYCAEASKVALPDKAQRVWNWLDACGWIGLEAYDEPEPYPTTEQLNALVELIRKV